jgi:metal-responsive CopG/Arc/MetJ family transcriptional regulator
MVDRVTVKIPRELYQNLSSMIAGTGFSSVNEFIVFVMRTLAMTGEIKGRHRLTARDVRAVRNRLARLGYLREN